jgi:ferredoxin--NADP+ reductase
MLSAALIDRREAAPGHFLLTIERPEGWAFRAGQFARLGLEVGGEPVFRAYSIASAPSDGKTLAFLIKAQPGGTLSPRITALPEGSAVLIDGPAQGSFGPRRIPGGEAIWLFATGPGLAPFLSLLKDREALSAWREVRCVVGASYRAQADALAALAAEAGEGLAGFSVMSAASREPGPLTGRLTALLKDGELERAAGRAAAKETDRVMLCGNEDFVADMRAIFKERGIVSPRLGRPGELVAELL